jgi:hypothetical protein
MTSTYEIAGRTVTMPVEVRDASSGTVLYDVDAGAAAALLPDGFDVVESSPGRATFAIALVDYRDNDLGSYLEVGLILFARPAEGGEEGNLILHLPVDKPFTCEAGRRIWGFPKTLQDIRREDADGSTTWTLVMDGELAVRVTLPRGGTEEMARMDMTSYTVRDGVRHATSFAQWGTGSSMTFGGDGVTLELGTAPVAKELRSLGLPCEPMMSTWTERMQATFSAPRPL